MRRLALALAAMVAALGGPAVSTAQEEHAHGGADDQVAATVPIQFAAFGTPRVDVLAGDTVRWMNTSIRVHTVTADDGTWASGRLPGDDMFTHRFDGVGVSTYYCMLHPFMRGEVDVHNVLLAVPTEPGAPGRSYVLHGRSSAPSGTDVGIEADTGAGFQAAGHATVDADGTFTTQIEPTTTATYRRGDRRRQWPWRHRQRARGPGVEGGARRPAAAPAPALRLVAGGPCQAQRRLGGALLPAPGAPLSRARGPDPA
jgi:plastocyanin